MCATVRTSVPECATIVAGGGDAQAELVLAQRVAVATAQLRELDPDRPRYLGRTVVLADR